MSALTFGYPCELSRGMGLGAILLFSSILLIGPPATPGGTPLQGCGVDKAIDSGKYLCETNLDCEWGWACMMTSSGQKRCVDPAVGMDLGVQPTPDGQLTPVKNDAGPLIPLDAELPDRDGTPGLCGNLRCEPQAGENIVTCPYDCFTPPDLGVDINPTLCVPNMPICDDLVSTLTCNAVGTAFLPREECPAGKRCEQGVCLDASQVWGSVSLGIQIYKDTLGGDWKYNGALNAGFSYGAVPSNPSEVYQAPPVDTCRLDYPSSGSTGTNGVSFDGGQVDVVFSTASHSLTYNMNQDRYNKVVLSDSTFPYGETVSFSGQGKELAKSSFSGTIAVPPKRMITAPAHNGEHIKGQPLEVQWSGATGAGTVRLDIFDIDSFSNSTITCTMTDDGQFTVPSSFLAGFQTPYPLGLIMITSTATPFSAQGLQSASGTAVILMQSEVILTEAN